MQVLQEPVAPSHMLLSTTLNNRKWIISIKNRVIIIIRKKGIWDIRHGFEWVYEREYTVRKETLNGTTDELCVEREWERASKNNK